MELLIISLILYFGGKWLVEQIGPWRHLCRECAQFYQGEAGCPSCNTVPDSHQYLDNEIVAFEPRDGTYADCSVMVVIIR
jgi:hypothetical protein